MNPDREPDGLTFAQWIDREFPAPVDDGRSILQWLADRIKEDNDLAQTREDRRRSYKHRWLMENNGAYRAKYEAAVANAEAWERAYLKGEEYQEQEDIPFGKDGFWEQFS